ncbi:MAG: enhanced serine sensitivity protein SseB C-terminal domain-containing protein [Tepidisphaeraceae bacterium]
MGIFDKLFGGKKDNVPAPSPTPAPSTPGPTGQPVARRERTKREEVAPAAEAALKQAIGDSPLLQAINAVVAGDSPATRTQVYVQLLQTDLFLLLGDAPEGSTPLPNGEVTLQQGQPIALLTIAAPDGKGSFLPAFTDVERTQRAIPDGNARYVRLNARAVFQLLLQNQDQGVVINPGQPPSGVITRAEAELLAQGVVPQFDENGRLMGQTDQQVKVMLAKPKDPPPAEFVAAVRQAASEQPLVQEAHIFMAAIGEQPPKVMIGLLLDEAITQDELHAAFNAVGMQAQNNRGGLEGFDMLPLQAQMLDAVKQLDGLIYRR